MEITIESLPEELLENIFSYLDSDSVWSAMQTCPS
jgi:hypothetical protein